MTDLVERLHRNADDCEDQSRWATPELAPFLREAATALEAKDKELADWKLLAKSRGEVLVSAIEQMKEAQARAETAERVVVAAWNAFGGTQISTAEQADELAIAAEGDLDEQIKTQVEQLATAEREREDQKIRADINYDLFVDAERNRAEAIIVVNLLRRERDEARAALKLLTPGHRAPGCWCSYGRDIDRSDHEIGCRAARAITGED